MNKLLKPNQGVAKSEQLDLVFASAKAGRSAYQDEVQSAIREHLYALLRDPDYIIWCVDYGNLDVTDTSTLQVNLTFKRIEE